MQLSISINYLSMTQKFCKALSMTKEARKSVSKKKLGVTN